LRLQQPAQFRQLRRFRRRLRLQQPAQFRQLHRFRRRRRPQRPAAARSSLPRSQHSACPKPDSKYGSLYVALAARGGTLTLDGRDRQCSSAATSMQARVGGTLTLDGAKDEAPAPHARLDLSIIWQSDGNQMAIRWQSDGNHVAIIWQPYGNHMAIRVQSGCKQGASRMQAGCNQEAIQSTCAPFQSRLCSWTRATRLASTQADRGLAPSTLVTR
jgi:hypothetical protein